MSGNQQETLSALRESNSGIACDDGRKPCARRGGGEHDAIFIDSVNAGRVASHERVVNLEAHDFGFGRVQRRVGPDLARPEVQRGDASDELAAVGGVLLGEQAVHRNLVELGIAVVGVTIGVCQFQRLDQCVEIVGGIPSHGTQVIAFENVERFNKRWSLAPEAGLVNLKALKISGYGVFRRKMERGHVLVTQQSVVFPAELVDAMGDVAAVKKVPYSLDRRRTAGSGSQSFLFRVYHGAQSACQIGLAENLAGHRHAVAGNENVRRAWPQLEELNVAFDGTSACLINRQAVG